MQLISNKNFTRAINRD